MLNHSLPKLGLALVALVSASAGGFSVAFGQQDRTQWKDYGGGPDNSHYITLNQINQSNVKDLKIAWSYPTRDGHESSWFDNSRTRQELGYTPAALEEAVAETVVWLQAAGKV